MHFVYIITLKWETWNLKYKKKHNPNSNTKSKKLTQLFQINVIYICNLTVALILLTNCCRDYCFHTLRASIKPAINTMHLFTEFLWFVSFSILSNELLSKTEITYSRFGALLETILLKLSFNRDTPNHSNTGQRSWKESGYP